MSFIEGHRGGEINVMYRGAEEGGVTQNGEHSQVRYSN